MEKKLPIYKYVLKEGDELNFGVDGVALVDSPAIERTFVAFADQKQKFKISNEERHIITGPAMIADLPIYRNDKMGEYYAVFDKETIQQSVFRFFKNGWNKVVNDMHDPTAKLGGVILFESIIIDSSRGINVPSGFADAPDGSWFVSYYVENDEVWQSVKDGKFVGFSIEGYFDKVPETMSDEDAILNLIAIAQGAD